ncbi:glycosyltransferase involved in cell wall biosynthesis [Lewinella marina]|uniref:Group 1 glycosyl transferase n=1 Tax=Neolewinella marina TaxID=438751 RepID=A0A2G0CEB5_9BACT|nr:glycosyltransferase family 4 protein [Neolewinella marina]NJB87431.1 glycosyltransferase involved in cell wall biosynthesis [Neolewinella marina]PHK98260.1 group 1 glycosyl transferase [Neolewinella marina]
MKKLKILFPAGSFYPAQTGGPDNTVYWITKALTRRGHQPTISTTDRGQGLPMPRDRWLDTDYGTIIYTRNPHHYLPLNLVRRAVGQLAKADVLHLSMITYPASLLMAVINSWFYGKPMLWSSRGDLDPPMLLRSPKRKAMMIKLINTLVKKDLLWFHSTCDAETTYIRNNFGQDSKVIQIPNYMELPERIVTNKEKYFLYIGRIDPKKAIENLIEAMSRSTTFLNSEFTLKIVGDYYNDYGRGLVKQVEDLGLTHKIRFLGHRDGREKEELLAAAWFTFMPSHTENFGIVVMEGLAQGTPAVASTGTPWEILEKHEAGYWIPNDSDSLLRIIEHIHTISPERMKVMNKNALRLAREEFSIHANVGEWEAAYQKLISCTTP